MKKIFKISLVMVGMLATLNANAGNSSILLDLKKVDGKKVSFTLNEMKNVKLSIYDSSEALIFNETVSGNKLSRTYDLAALPDGDYFMEAESDLKISKYKLEVKGNVATLSPEAVSEVFKPVFEYDKENGTLSISLKNDIKMPVYLNIYDGDRELLYSKSNSSEEISGKTFDMNNLTGNECTFVVSYTGKTFEKTISL